MLKRIWYISTEIVYMLLMLTGIGAIIALVCISAQSHASPTIKIAIIDSGYNQALVKKLNLPRLKLCESGHYDFNKGTPTIGFTEDHGTIIGSIIAAILKDTDYCAEIYSALGPDRDKNILNIIEAFEKASRENLTAINASFGGEINSYREYNAIAALSDKTRVFAAAGNNNQNLNETCVYFPACYAIASIQVVGALSPDQTQKALYSNYGSKVLLWYPGSIRFNQEYEEGTSIATPRALADYVLQLSRSQH